MKNVLYLGASRDGSAPGDRRRFISYASKNPNIKVYFDESSRVKFDLLIVALGGDLVKAIRLSEKIPKLVIDYTNHYLAENSILKSSFRNIANSITGKSEWTLSTYKSTILKILRKADLVICPSINQVEYLDNIGIRSERLTDFFQSEVKNKDWKGLQGDDSLFWEGQATNIKHLELLSKAYKGESQNKIRIVSDQTYGVMGGRIFPKSTKKYCKSIFYNFEFYNWTINNLNNAAKKSSIGVIPLDLKDSFASAKPENKLVLMWLLGLPTLCSPTKSYNMLADQTGIDFICRTNLDWTSSITQLISDKANRIEQAKYLNDFALKNYSDEALSTRWHNAFLENNIF